jgi:hypothetical protein
VYEGHYFGLGVAIKDLTKVSAAVDRQCLAELAKECLWRFNLESAFVSPLLAVNVDPALGPVALVLERQPCRSEANPKEGPSTSSFLRPSPKLHCPRLRLLNACSLWDLLHDPAFGPSPSRGYVGPEPELMRSLPLSMKQRLEWLRHVSLALAHLHAKGIVHRSLSSRNVMLALSDDGPRGGFTAAGPSLQRTTRRGVVAQVSR